MTLGIYGCWVNHDRKERVQLPNIKLSGWEECCRSENVAQALLWFFAFEWTGRIEWVDDARDPDAYDLASGNELAGSGEELPEWPNRYDDALREYAIFNKRPV